MSTAAPNALAVALESESLHALYAAWLELRLQRAQLGAELARERAQLEGRAQLMLKAVEVAKALPEKPSRPRNKTKLPARADPLAAFHRKAEAELARAKRALGARERRELRALDAHDARVRKALLARADQHLAIHKPRLELTLHPVGEARALLELASFGDEDAVLLMRLLSRKLPTRWGYFADDAVEELARGPARFYPDLGNEQL